MITILGLKIDGQSNKIIKDKVWSYHKLNATTNILIKSKLHPQREIPILISGHFCSREKYSRHK